MYSSSHYIPCKSCESDKKKEAVLGPLFWLVPVLSGVGVATVVTHFAHEDPDQPEAAGEGGQDDVEDQVAELVLTHWGSFQRDGFSL